MACCRCSQDGRARACHCEMIVTNNQAAAGNSVGESVQLRHNAAQLRRADSNKSGPNVANNASALGATAGTVANNLNSPVIGAASRTGSKARPSQFQHNVTGNNAASVSSPALLHSMSTAGSLPIGQHSLAANAAQDSRWPCTFHFICSRFFLFLCYLLLLLSLIINTFLHFIIYGSNMSIGALFLDVHHRYELVVGDYYSLDPHTTALYLNRDNWAHSPVQQRPNSEALHCDRDSFLSLLDEFYHNPKATVDSSYDSDPSSPSDQLYNRAQLPSRSKPYPKIFANFNKEQSQNKAAGNSDEDQLYYSSSTSTNSHVDSARRMAENQWQLQKRYEHRLLIIEIAALVLLFVLVLTQIIGLVAVMRKHLVLLILVTAVDALLFCLLFYVASFALLTLLLLAVLVGFWFILQVKFGAKKSSQMQQRLKEDIASEMRDVVSQSGARTTPCISVSMEQYEAMTQQMLHRYSSPIVYCPHYNESLC